MIMEKIEAAFHLKAPCHLDAACHLKAVCHCGNISISAMKLPATVTSCNCSICRRYAALWAYYKPADVEVKFLNDESTFYIWGDRELEFHRCVTCGCVTHYVTTDKFNDPIFAINARMIETEILEAIPVRYANGAAQ